MSLRDQLDAIRVEHNKLTAKLVVNVARDVDHPLHSRFEWDDTIAGEKYRRRQAMDLIQSVKIKYTTQEGERHSVRAYHSVPQPSGQAYVPLEEAIEDPFTKRVVLQAAEREWRDMYSRYRHIEEFLSLVRSDLGQPPPAEAAS